MARKASTTKATAASTVDEVEVDDQVEAAPIDAVEVEAPAVEDASCNVEGCKKAGTHHGLCCAHWATRRGERTR